MSLSEFGIWVVMVLAAGYGGGRFMQHFWRARRAALAAEPRSVWEALRQWAAIPAAPRVEEVAAEAEAPVARDLSTDETDVSVPSVEKKSSVNLESTPSPAPAPRTTQVNLSLNLVEGTRTQIVIKTIPGVDEPIIEHTVTALNAPMPTPPAPPLNLGPQWNQLVTRLAPLLKMRPLALRLSLETTLFILALAFYFIVHVIGLENFPIYFFTDEAVQTVRASEFVRDGWRNADREFLPTYFQNGPFYNLSISVYAQVLPYVLWGQSIFLTRLVSVLITLLGAAAISLTLRDIFHIKIWWLGGLVLSLMPVWFLHSRTAFESVEMAALYACFLYAYLLYRTRGPRYLNAALVFGALAFYTYSPGQLVVGVTGVLLLISDARYHWQHRAHWPRAALVLGLLALPYLRFRLAHPEAMVNQLYERGSYWVQPLPLVEKIVRFVGEYLYGLSPVYWFWPNGRDLLRHVMLGQAHLFTPAFPFAVAGLIWCARRIRTAEHRALLLALLATPTGGALAEISVLRVLAFVIPATLLTVLGVAWLLAWLEKRHVPYRTLALSALTLTSFINLYLLRDALVNGPTWFDNYGLYGLQYGAKELVRDAIPAALARNPNTRLIVSPTWANGTDLFVQFFLTPEEQARLQVANVDFFIVEQRPLTPNDVLVMTPDEFDRARVEPKFQQPLVVEDTLLYPNRTPGFYFVRLAYVDNVAAVFAAEREARQRPLTDTVTIEGQPAQALYSQLGAGELSHLFDHDRFTLVRGLEANPLVMEFTFASPRPVTSFAGDYGTIPDFTVTLSLYAPGLDTPVVYSQTYVGLGDDPHADLPLPNPPPLVSKVRFEIHDNRPGDTAQIHVRELWFAP